MTGAEEFADAIEQLKKAAEENRCDMDDGKFREMAHSLLAMFHLKVPKTYSREKAAIELGISLRQLYRIMEATDIKPHRDGNKVVFLTENDIQVLKEYLARKHDG